MGVNPQESRIEHLLDHPGRRARGHSGENSGLLKLLAEAAAVLVDRRKLVLWMHDEPDLLASLLLEGGDAGAAPSLIYGAIAAG